MNTDETIKSVRTLLAPLIASQTTSHQTAAYDQSNKTCIDYLANWFNDYGFCCNVQPVPDTHNKYNLIAHIDRGPGGIWLCGHSDTVAADLHHWSSDPWKLKENDHGDWQGLGVCDMKGFIAQMMALIQQRPITDWKQSLTLVVTADEETTMAGARALAKQSINKPDSIFIGEPTANQPVIGHKGFVSLQIQFTCEGGHSSLAGERPDAMLACHTFMGKLYALREQWKHRYKNAQFALPWPTLNPGQLIAGDSVNRICSHATLMMEFRPIPGFPIEEAINEITALARQTADANKLTSYVSQNQAAIPAYCCTNTMETIETLSEQKTTTASYCTEAPFFSEFCSQVLVMGPGRIEQAHQANETLYLEDLYRSMQIYQKVLAHYCL